MLTVKCCREYDIDGDSFVMLNTESIKELVPAMGLRLKFQSAFANLIPASETIDINPDADDVCDNEAKEEFTVQTTVNSRRPGIRDRTFKGFWPQQPIS